MTRDDAYRLVQRNAMTHLGGARARSSTCSRDDADVVAALGDDRARRLLRPQAPRSANVDRTFDALDALDGRSSRTAR